ncbi:MAG: hypothetical protein LBF93_02400, partial [Zoogloeaceae bacterium]|nr:hypothetical protein [Zoogloeaceae bacterium]
MSVKTFDTAVVIARLREKAPGFKTVGHAGSLSGIRRLAAFLAPGAYVLSPRERRASGGPDTGRTQAVEATLSVAIVATRYRERNAPGGLDLPELIRQEREALMNWIAPWPEQSA